jgi:hypothetical protein
MAYDHTFLKIIQSCYTVFISKFDIRENVYHSAESIL